MLVCFPGWPATCVNQAALKLVATFLCLLKSKSTKAMVSFLKIRLNSLSILRGLLEPGDFFAFLISSVVFLFVNKRCCKNLLGESQRAYFMCLSEKDIGLISH